MAEGDVITALSARLTRKIIAEKRQGDDVLHDFFAGGGRRLWGARRGWRKRMTQAQWRGAHVQAGRRIRRKYADIFAGVARAAGSSASKLFLRERVLAAFDRQALHDFILGIALEGREIAASLACGICKRQLLEALESVKGHGLCVKKIAAMMESRVRLAKVHNSAALANSRFFSAWGDSFSTTTEGGNPKLRYDFDRPYSLSKSVWGAVDDAEGKILNLVQGSIAQGRDVKDVAGDLMAYVKGGSQVIPGRWGKLEPGTAEYIKRFGSAGVDYRALRIYRSEQYRYLQQEAVRQAKNSPSFGGKFEWARFPGGPDCGICEKLAAGSPYAADAVPGYPHPNCMCSIIPQMKTDEEFSEELRAFVNGEPEGDAIERWARENGLFEDGLFEEGGATAEGEDNFVPVELDSNRIYDYSEVDEKIAIGRECEWLRRYSEESKVEAMSILADVKDKTGKVYKKVLGSWKGTYSQINIHKAKAIMDIIKNYPAGSLTVIHTHTNNTAFSLKDLTILLNNASISTMFAQAVKGKRYTMSIPASFDRNKFSLRDLEDMYKEFREKLINSTRNLGRDITEQDAVKISHTLNWMIAIKKGWVLTPRPSSLTIRNRNMDFSWLWTSEDDHVSLEERREVEAFLEEWFREIEARPEGSGLPFEEVRAKYLDPLLYGGF